VREETAHLRERLEALEASLAEIEADDTAALQPNGRRSFEAATGSGIRTGRRKGVHT
jgi:hypothetical protein